MVKKVADGNSVADGLGVVVVVGNWVLVGVQDGGKAPISVGVLEGKETVGRSVAGGKGLKAEYGFNEIIRKNPIWQRTPINAVIVRIFQILPDWERIEGGLSVWLSILSMSHPMININKIVSSVTLTAIH